MNYASIERGDVVEIDSPSSKYHGLTGTYEPSGHAQADGGIVRFSECEMQKMDRPDVQRNWVYFYHREMKKI